ncbi:hypothetical protein BGZ83_002748 [Gryganskiella cystojenkinii]|nr:hypothetical protein BGZ83_002748 [Gryganskiella cystojenkinii]
MAGRLCREYMNNHPSTNTTSIAMGPLEIGTLMEPSKECLAPEIQAYAATTLAMIEVLGAVAGTLTIGYYSSLSDKLGRVKIMILAVLNHLLMLTSVYMMDRWWDEIGLPLMAIMSLIGGLLGGIGTSSTMSLAYAADCTDPAKRSLVFSWLHAGLFVGMTIGKQSPRIRKLYEAALEAAGSSLEATKSKKQKDANNSSAKAAWYTHFVRSMAFFVPNGENINLILLGAISFLQTLALKGTFSVLILYTNQVFNWTEYEDGILFSMSSLVRLLSLLILLPIMVHLYNKYFRKNSPTPATTTNATKKPSTSGHSSRHGTEQDVNSNDNNNNNNDIYRNEHLDGFSGLEDPIVASSVEHLGEAALNLSDDEASFQERRRRQSTADSAATWGSDRTHTPSQSQSLPKKKKDDSSTTPRTKEQVMGDLKLDTWVIRIGFIVNSLTYVGYGLATQTWMFYLASALHATSIIAAPSLKTLMTNLVEPSEFGAVLGSLQVLDSVSGIFSPLLISSVFALTVKSRPEFVWYLCAFLTGTCAVLSFMIRQKQFIQRRPSNDSTTGVQNV